MRIFDGKGRANMKEKGKRKRRRASPIIIDRGGLEEDETCRECE
jgi:hypothetical protein